ncbi:MAG: lysophospholipid acyltransferase family protein [Bryobacteraceae bacterium]|jgi:1-acyl-sn-glycerol-3-phosphate acyltransferase
MLGFLRAALLTDPLIVLATIVMGTASLATSLFDATGRAQHGVARLWARMLLRIGRVRVRVEGLERIAPESSYVFVSNHLSYMDTPLVIAHIPCQFRFLAKQGLFKVPFIGYHLKRAGHIPVPRGDARASLRTLAESARIVRDRGVSVLVFPEGGRSPGAMREFKPGAAYIAIKAGVPAVPLGIAGTRQILPMDSLLVRGGQVLLRIGEPIPTSGMAIHDHRQLSQLLRQRVLELSTAQRD